MLLAVTLITSAQHNPFSAINAVNGTEWVILCWCEVKKLYSLTHPLTRSVDGGMSAACTAGAAVYFLRTCSYSGWAPVMLR